MFQELYIYIYASLRPYRPPVSIIRIRSLELILDVHQPIVLDNPLSPARAARFEMPRAQPDREVRDEIVRRLSRPVRDEDAPAVAVRCLSTMKHRQFEVQHGGLAIKFRLTQQSPD